MSKLKRKKRSDKFPLTLHPTGQYCKKIKGKLYYFGTDKQCAFVAYLEQAACLHTGRQPKPESEINSLSVKTACNLYLEYQQSRVTAGEIKQRHLNDQKSNLRFFARFVGTNRSILAVSAIDLQNYRRKMISTGMSAYTINNKIAVMKAMYHWMLENQVIDQIPNLKAVKKLPIPKKDRPIFTSSQVETLLGHANTQMRAMIWLGLNCGFGCTDCAELGWDNLDLDRARVCFPRGKTGVARHLPLWPETVKALKMMPKKGERVFVTKRGNPWVRTTRKMTAGGVEKSVKNDAVSKEFAKLLKQAGLKTEKGVGFYTLRRTAATLAARSGDPFAVQKLLGHADLKMATTYVQDVSEQTDRVINNTRKLIIQDDS